MGFSPSAGSSFAFCFLHFAVCSYINHTRPGPILLAEIYKHFCEMRSGDVRVGVGVFGLWRGFHGGFLSPLVGCFFAFATIDQQPSAHPQPAVPPHERHLANSTAALFCATATERSARRSSDTCFRVRPSAAPRLGNPENWGGVGV